MTKTECRALLRAAMGDADKGLAFDAGTLTVGRYLDGWLRDVKNTVKAVTFERYEQ